MLACGIANVVNPPAGRFHGDPSLSLEITDLLTHDLERPVVERFVQQGIWDLGALA